MGEPTRRLNIMEADEPPAPLTLKGRWDRMPTGVQAAVIVVLLGGVTGVFTAAEMIVVHLGLSDAVPDAIGWTFLALMVWGVVWFICAGIRGELDK